MLLAQRTTKGRSFVHSPLMKKYLVEFIGTFFLVFTIGATVIPQAVGVIPPLAIGAVLMAMIFAGGHISGAHYNPAVTIGLWLRGATPVSDILPYIVAQLTAAAAAAGIAEFLFGAGETMPLAGLPQAFVAEFLFTFALMFVILNVATAKGTSGNSFYGLAIGFTVMAAAFSVGAVSSAALNPAVVLALGLMNLVAWTDLWVLLAGSILGAVVAAGVFRYVTGNEPA